jgi:putative ABC transport system permease protein
MDLLKKLGFGVAMAFAIIVPIALLIFSPWWLLLACAVLLALAITFTRTGRQTWSITEIGLATIPQRLASSSVVVVGIAGVVGVLIALLAMGAGFESALRKTGTDDTALVVQNGSQSEIDSVMDHDTGAIISQAPQVLKNAQGHPIASPELITAVSLPKKRSGFDASIEMRGVGERVWELRPNVRIIEGRKFKPGLRELIVGKSVDGQFGGADMGSTLNLNGQSWTVVGIFDAGDAHNSEIWGDTDVIGSALRRGSNKSSLTVRLTDAQAFDPFKAGLASDPRLKVNVQTTRHYYDKQSEELARMIRILGTTVGAIMAVGAVFGALNSMYAAVAARSREIATLRAIGFLGVPLILSVLLETMFLAVLGGGIGAAIAWTIFDGFTTSTAGNSGQVVFAFNISPALLWIGLKWALAIGFIGGLLPAVRAARMSVMSGLREL